MSDERKDDVSLRDLWNGWWTIAAIAGALTIITLLLEGFGVLHDWGLILSALGILVTLFAAQVGATSVSVRAMHREIGAIHDTLGHVLVVLNKIYIQLGGR